MCLIDILSWTQNNIIALCALLASFVTLWNNFFRVKNRFKAILIHEDMEDFFVLQNDGNKDQILLDYFYGYKYHPKQEYLGILMPNNAEPIVIKPGQKQIIKPHYSLNHFIKTRIDRDYTWKEGPVIMQELIDEDLKDSPFIIGMAFKFLSPKGKVKVKYFNYAIWTKEAIILSDKVLHKSFIYLNK